MPRGWRVANVGARGEVAMLVGKHTLQHKEFLAAVVAVGGKAAMGCIAHDAGRPGDFAADAIQHTPLHPDDRRGGPGQLGAMHGNALAKVGIELHGRMTSAAAC